MKTHLIFLLGLIAFIALFALTLLGYLVYSLCGEVYDEITGQWRRRRMKNKRFDATAGRDCYSYIRGVRR